MTASTLTAGVGRTNITPPIGTRMLGYILRIEPAIGIASQLYCTALVLADEHTKVVIIDCDLCTFTVARADEIRQQIADAIGTTRSHVLLAYTHTHNGPLVEAGRLLELSDVEKYYIANLAHYIVSAAKMADANRRPARVAAGAGIAPVAINRIETLPDNTVILGQNPQGVTDHEVSVVRVDGMDGLPIAALVNYAAHPVVLGPDAMLIDADYPGVVREVVERATGATCLFLMGAAGDQMPIEAWTTSTDSVRKMGNIIGYEAARVYCGIETRRMTVKTHVVKSLAEVLVYELEDMGEHTHTILAATEKRIALPFIVLPSLAEAEQTLAEMQTQRARAAANNDARMTYIGDIEVTWATRLRDAARAGKQPEPVVGVVQAIRIDEVAILTAPGEAFVGMGLEAKARSPLKHTLYASYANGGLGYIRTPDAYPKPNQRVVTPDAVAHKWVYTTPFAPECAGLVVSAGLELLEELG